MTDADVRGLLDREEIRDLALRYCDAIVRRDVDGVMDVFAENGEFVVPEQAFQVDEIAAGSEKAERRYQGSAALRKMYAESMTSPAPLPAAGNNIVRLSGENTAVGRCMAQIRYAHNSKLLSLAYYDDEYVRTPRGWKFKRRNVTLRQFNRDDN
jgi:SnoaL-like domain